LQVFDRASARHRLPVRPSVIGSVLAVLLTALLSGCATLSPDEREAKKVELDAMAETTLQALLASTPQAREVLDQSLGYMVMDLKVTKIPVFGAGKGYAVAVDKRTESRSYLAVSRFEIGGGLGAQAFKVVVIFTDAKPLEKAAGGAWHYDAGAELAAGSPGDEGSVQKKTKGFQSYRIAEGGAAATVTVRIARAKPF
jgi:lipid-binding SYLF domain-containing protein